MNCKDLMEQATLVLLQQHPFYGHLLSQMRKIPNSKTIPSAGVYITDKINLEYNNEFIESLETPIHVANVLKHECEHIVKDHIGRAMDLGITPQTKELMKRMNLATDATINVGELTPTVEKIGGITVKGLNEYMKGIDKDHVDMPDGELAEYYYSQLNKFAEKNKDSLPEAETDDHDCWEKSDKSGEALKEITRQAVNKAVERSGGIGNVPGDLVSYIEALNKSQVNWKKELRHFVANSIKSDKRSTVTKRNRRYGIMFPGKKTERKLTIAVCVDTSGSVSDYELGLFWSELSALHKTKARVIVIEADSVVQNVYDFDPKKQPSFKGRCGTAYQPAIDKAVEFSPDAIAYLGDFDAADQPTDPKIPFLWVGVRNSPPPAKFGKVIRLPSEK